MSQPQEAPFAKLIVRFLFRDHAVQMEALRELSGRFGPSDCLTEPGPFTFTDYYDKEMGPAILRQTCSFDEPVRPETLPDIKLFTNGIENRFRESGKRRVNIDPGLLTEERFVLATGKNFTHRIYLRDGIYADLTLIFQKGAYRPLPWTYPDCRTPEFLRLLLLLRENLRSRRSGNIPKCL